MHCMQVAELPPFIHNRKHLPARLDLATATAADGPASAAGASGSGKKKKRKSAAAAGADADGGAAPAAADDPLLLEHDWRLRLKVIRALHRCLLYDSGAAAGGARFLDDQRFLRLLPPLVAHLGLRPPASLAPALQADGLVGE